MRKRFQMIIGRAGGLLLLAAIVSVPGLGESHPGRLAADGCHRVRKNFEYASGIILQTGNVHCHRPLTEGGLGGLRLDGRETLMDQGPMESFNDDDTEDVELSESP